LACDFFLFSKMKLKLKGRWFDNTEEIQAKLHRVLDTLREKDLQEAFQNGDGGNGVYMQRGTTGCGRKKSPATFFSPVAVRGRPGDVCFNSEPVCLKFDTQQ
jgi:hypothetical protein